MAVDGQHIYWASQSGNTVGRANLDGSSPDQSFISLPGFPGPNGVAVDDRHIYWTSGSPGAIGRANLDGSAVDRSFIATGDANPFGVAVDGQHIYWANRAAGTIGRANLDGSSPNPGFITVLGNPAGVAVDSLPHASATSVACSPAAVMLPASTSCTVTVSDPAAGPSAPTGTVAFTSADGGSFGSPASCSLVTPAGAHSACQVTFTPSVAGAETIAAAYLGDTRYAASGATAGLSVFALPLHVLAPPFGKPSNSFTLSRPSLSKRNGSATMTATVPGPGKLLLTGRGIKKLARFVTQPGKVKLTIKGQPRIQRRLGRTGKATINVKVTYTPTGGDPNTESKKLTLRRGRR